MCKTRCEPKYYMREIHEENSIVILISMCIYFDFKEIIEWNRNACNVGMHRNWYVILLSDMYWEEQWIRVSTLSFRFQHCQDLALYTGISHFTFWTLVKWASWRSQNLQIMCYRARVQKDDLWKKCSVVKYIEETLIHHFQFVDS